MKEAPPWAEDRKSSGPIPLDSLSMTCREDGEGTGQIVPSSDENHKKIFTLN
jgi:hypothetical protein